VDTENKVDIQISADGAQAARGVNEVADSVQELAGKLGGELGQQAQAAADKLRELGKQEKAVEEFLSLQTQVGATERAIKQLTREADAYAAQIAASGQPTANEVAQLERLRTSAATASEALGQQKVRLAAAAAEMQRHGIASEGASQALARVRGEIGQTAQGVGQLDPKLKQVVQGWRGVGQGADEAGGKLNAIAELMQGKINSAFRDLTLSMGGLFAAAKLKNLAEDAIALADAYGQMSERIKAATPIAGEYDTVQKRILATANLTYRPLQEQQELYIRTAEALRSLSYSTGEALDITDSLSYLFTTNAASAERASGAIDAYTKSIQSGQVDARSWQAILVATPTIVDAIAKATGRTAAEIRQMGITGNLALRDLNEGLRQSVNVNKQAAAQMSATVKDAVTRLANTWQAYVGEANKASGATKEIVKLIDKVSENLDTVVNTAIRVGEVMAAVWAAKALVALKQYIAALIVAQKEAMALGVASAAAAGKAGSSWAAAATAAGGKIAMAGKMAMAAWIGWEIGSYLREEFQVAEQAGIALAAGLHKVAARAQGAWEMIKAAFTDDTVEAAQERLRVKLQQIDDEYADLFNSADRATQAQRKQAAEAQKLAAATAQAGTAAGKAAAQWAVLKDGYEKAGEQIKKATELLDRESAARIAHAQTAVRMAQAFGDETQKREAAAKAAQVQADEDQRLANVRASEVAALESQRKAILALDEGYRNSTPEVQQKLAELNESIPLRKADAAAAEEQARQSQIAAAQAQIEAESLKDNSARVGELRAAHDSAKDAYLRVLAAYQQGKATLGDVTKAEIEAGKAAALHRDAVQDLERAMKSKAQAEQANFSLEEMSLRVAIEQQKAIGEICKARGDEKGAIAAQNQVRRLEIELLELQAQAKRAEASAQLAAVEAKRAELIASGQLTAQKRDELDAAIKAAQVLEKQAEIAEITAQKTRALADETASATGRMKKGWDDAGSAVAGYGRAVEKVSERYYNKDKFASDASGTALSFGMTDEMFNQYIRRNFGEEFIGNETAKKAANLKMRLDYLYKVSDRTSPDGSLADMQQEFERLKREMDKQKAQERQARQEQQQKPASPQPSAPPATGERTGAPPQPAPAPGAGQTFINNYTLPGGKRYSIALPDAANQQALDVFVRQLWDDKARAA